MQGKQGVTRALQNQPQRRKCLILNVTFSRDIVTRPLNPISRHVNFYLDYRGFLQYKVGKLHEKSEARWLRPAGLFVCGDPGLSPSPGRPGKERCCRGCIDPCQDRCPTARREPCQAMQRCHPDRNGHAASQVVGSSRRQRIVTLTPEAIDRQKRERAERRLRAAMDRDGGRRG